MGYFKSLFGPCQDEVWSALRAQIGAQKLQAQAGDWPVTLDEYMVMTMAGKVHHAIPYTRLRAPFPNSGGFRFTIHRASIFSSLGKLLGMQDIEVGYPEFDNDFVIKSNDEEKVKTLCRSDRLRDLVTAQPSFQLTIEDDDGWFGARYPADIDVLVFNVAESIRDVERLKGLYDVFGETLHRLSEMGVAGRGSGGVKI